MNYASRGSPDLLVLVLEQVVSDVEPVTDTRIEQRRAVPTIVIALVAALRLAQVDLHRVVELDMPRSRVFKRRSSGIIIGRPIMSSAGERCVVL